MCLPSRFPLLSTAQTAIADEQQRIHAEIDAFDAFTQRIQKLPAQSHNHLDTPYPTPIHERRDSQPPPTSDRVKAMYRDEIFGVDHWQHAYNETDVVDSMAEEFGSDIVTALTAPESTWSSLLQEQLCAASQNSVETRRNTLDCLSTEQTQIQTLSEALTEIREELTCIEHKTISFDDRTTKLEQLATRLDELADDHQSYVHERTDNDELFAHQIVYTDLDVEYPGLAAFGSIRTQLEALHDAHWAGTL